MNSEQVKKIEDLIVWQKAMALYDDFMSQDSEIIGKDYRGREIVKQLVRSLGSICANLEEGYGRSVGKEFRRYLIISRGSARESKGWYLRSKRFLPNDLLGKRVNVLDQILAMLTVIIKKIQ